MLVGRDTRNLDEKLVVSAAVESISENMVDGIISPIFYFTITYLLTNSIAAAVSFAAAFRVISTLDSMVGYKNKKFTDTGWFSARLDDVLNYIPARLSPVFFLNMNSVKIALRDHSKTPSPNSGWPMAAMAGYLGVSLKKAGYYTIGDEKEKIDPKHIKLALRVMERSIIIFILFNVFLIVFFYF
jgi:adenosylcobinamide-phosphate synthase